VVDGQRGDRCRLEEGRGLESVGSRVREGPCTRTISVVFTFNFMMEDESEDRLQATYGENFARLARIKAE